MAEYIEREAVLQKFADHVRRSNNSDFSPAPTWNQAVQIVEDFPAADVRPVVRGTWVGIDDFPYEDWECDHCGCVVGNTDDPWNHYHFCPNCGADMREPPKGEKE